MGGSPSSSAVNSPASSWRDPLDALPRRFQSASPWTNLSAQSAGRTGLGATRGVLDVRGGGVEGWATAGSRRRGGYHRLWNAGHLRRRRWRRCGRGRSRRGGKIFRQDPRGRRVRLLNRLASDAQPDSRIVVPGHGASDLHQIVGPIALALQRLLDRAWKNYRDLGRAGPWRDGHRVARGGQQPSEEMRLLCRAGLPLSSVASFASRFSGGG